MISTSLSCDLRPLCSIEKYNANNLAPAHGELTKSAAAVKPSGLGKNNQASEQLTGISAQELKFWSQFREEDYVIYQDWVGQIQVVTDEVTIRLSNGSVVVMQNPDELEEPYWLPGTPSSELHRSLLRLDFELHHTQNKMKPGKAWEAEPCYPGQILETKKGNLRRGVWKFGAYDPNIRPRGIVVDVRTVDVAVVWLYPNLFQPGRTGRSPPPDDLGVDILHSGAVTIYNHSRQPRRTGSSQLPEASYSPDVGFGHKVRFRDPAEAAVKYSNFNRVPRTATQGYDMNILQVTRVKTTVTVQWQDGSIATLPSVSLVPYDNVDDHDVWPGMLVSLKAEEVENKDADVTICQKIGVVQTADAAERVARIRWFADPIATIPRWDPYESVSPTKFGPISDDVNEVSFYDIVPHPALARSRGDMLIVVPNPLPPIDRVGAVQNGEYQEMVNEVYWNLKEDFDHTPSSNHIPQHRFRRNAFTSSDQDPSASNTAPQSSTDIDWFGEVVDLGLDGKMTVRLGAADEVRDIDLPYERAVLVASHGGNGQETDDEDSDEDSDETWEGGFATGDDSDRDHDVIFSLDVQYAGGRRLDASSNEEAWSTEDDEEMPDLIDISPASENQGRASPSENELPDLMPLSTRPGIASQQLSDEEMPDLRDFSAPSEQVGRQSGEEKMPGQIDAPAEDTQNLGQPTDTEHSTTSTSIPTRAELSTLVMAIQFSVISGPPPNDHHYYSKSPSLTSAKMRRITKEHQIMQSSLPEGVFVRAWEARLDLLRVLIIGPRETPYELAPFVIDFYFSDEFPSKPPEAYFHSWTNGVGRVNPNLYEDGNICLSLLGTWPGDTGKDTWSAKGSTMLQVIVSILGLVLVKEPYYSKRTLPSSHRCPM